MGALTTLSMDKKLGRSIISVGGLLLIVQALEKFPNEDNLTRRAIMTLFNLAANPLNSALVSQSDAVGALLNMLERHEGDQILIEKCTQFFYNLSTTQDSSEHLGKVGLIPNIIHTMVKWKDYETIADTTLGLLYNLVLEVPNRTIFARQKGVQATVIVMRANRQFKEIQRKCLAIFTALVIEEHLVPYLIEGRAILASLLSLRSFPTERLLFRASLVLLGNCLFFDQSRSEVVEKNGVMVVLDKIENFINDEEIAERVSLFILNATVDPKARRQIANSNGKMICEKLEQKYSTNQSISKRVKGALNNLRFK
ncbi:protein aardvark [Anaeramoeba flamelloides]|uniref:Protein aardvark n=1 Tax=Anaeramoeba flamelloides TaxID=1746091 RepID=A0AAV7YZ07_9EUKA|nr:protein aardvark [Anaeramoeba flamelloides]